MNCSALTEPANGQISYTAGATFGQTAIYSCNVGYNLVGNSTRTCHATGVWSGSEPTCQGMLLLALEYLSSETASQGTETFVNEFRLSFVFHAIVHIAKQLQNFSKKGYVRLCSRSVSVDMSFSNCD